MEKSVARSYALLYALRFALVVAVCLVFGLLFGYSAGGAVAWLGQRFAAAEAARSVSNLSPSGEIGKRESLGSELAGSEGSNPSTETLSPTLRAGPNVQDSRLGRPVQTDDLRSLSSVRNGSHLGEHREIKAHWGYCGNPQCTLCYPVADSKGERYQREQYFSRAVCHSMAAK